MIYSEETLRRRLWEAGIRGEGEAEERFLAAFRDISRPRWWWMVVQATIWDWP